MDEREVWGDESAFLSGLVGLRLPQRCGWLWCRMETAGTPRGQAEWGSAAAPQADREEAESLEKPFAKVQAVVRFLSLLRDINR